jgi:hypothetical protein
MNPVVHVLRRMGGHATTLLPFSLAIGLLFQNLSAAGRSSTGATRSPPATAPGEGTMLC